MQDSHMRLLSKVLKEFKKKEFKNFFKAVVNYLNAKQAERISASNKKRTEIVRPSGKFNKIVRHTRGRLNEPTGCS